MGNRIREGLEKIIGVCGVIIGAGTGVYIYGSCRGWEGAPYEICSVNTDLLLALSISVGAVAGSSLAVYVSSKLRESLGGRQETSPGL